MWLISAVQVLLFGVLAIEIKRKAPGAHTICEIVKARWGFHAHMVFLCFCFLTNIIVTAMLLLGGSAVVNALTGMNLYAASFLIPLGVIVYTLHGGLKATFLASYLHSVIGMLFFTSSFFKRCPEHVHQQRSIVLCAFGFGCNMGRFNFGGLIMRVAGMEYSACGARRLCIFGVCGKSKTWESQGCVRQACRGGQQVP